MNRFLVILKRPLLAILMFLLFQAFSSLLLLIVQVSVQEGNLFDNLSHVEVSPQVLAIGTLVCDLLILVACLFLFRRSVYKHACFVFPSAPWKRNLVGLMACCIGTVALDLLSEIADLPNLMEHQMTAMCRDPWGVAAIALVAPLAEEVMFRWGIMGHMLRSNSGVVLSILTSALFFGLIHINPAQVFFATAMGVLLGILYWRSGSLFWPCLLHMLNNSVACLQVWFLGDDIKDYSLVDAIGGASVAWFAIGALLATCVAMMCWYASGIRENK